MVRDHFQHSITHNHTYYPGLRCVHLTLYALFLVTGHKTDPVEGY